MSLNKKIVVTNRKIFYEYDILEKHEAGIVINGSEVKSLRESKASLQDSFCKIENGEAFIYNLHIALYEKSGAWGGHDPKRKRKLLLHKREIYRLFGRMTQRGLTLVPSEMYFNKSGITKLTICLTKRRKGPDKRELIKRRDLDRELRSQQSGVRLA